MTDIEEIPGENRWEDTGSKESAVPPALDDGNPWAEDDDIDDANDLPHDVHANVAHAPPLDEHGILKAVVRAHLDSAIAAAIEQLRSLRALRESLE